MVGYFGLKSEVWFSDFYVVIRNAKHLLGRIYEMVLIIISLNKSLLIIWYKYTHTASFIFYVIESRNYTQLYK